MGHGQSQPLEGGNLPPEKSEDKLAKKANDSLQGDVSKQGFEGLNSQVTQHNQQEKQDRNFTLDQQLQKNGTVKMGVITRNFNCSVEITGTDPNTGKAIEYVRGRSSDEVVRAKEAEAKPPNRADQEQAYKDKFGDDADKPLGTAQSLTGPQLDQIASYLAKQQPESPIPVLVAYGNDTASDVAPTPGQVYNEAQQDKVPGIGWTPVEAVPENKFMSGVPTATGSDGITRYQGHVSNVPEITKGVQNLNDVKDLGIGIGQGLGNVAQETIKYLSQPNAVENSLLQVGPALDNAVNYYANTPPDKVQKDAQQFVGAGTQVLDQSIGHPMTQAEIGKPTGDMMSIFVPIGSAKALTAKEIEALGGAEKLGKMTANELEALGLERKMDEAANLVMRDGKPLQFSKESGVELVLEASGNPQDPVWPKGWAKRGFEAEDHMGRTGDLVRNFPTIDEPYGFKDGKFASFKSINLEDKTYQDAKRLESAIENKGLWPLENWQGRSTPWAGTRIYPHQVKERILHYAIPNGVMSEEQLKVFEKIGNKIQEYNAANAGNKRFAPIRFKVEVVN